MAEGLRYKRVLLKLSGEALLGSQAFGIDDAVVEGAVERVRPKMMTVTAIMAGLLPILWGSGAGASVMKRIAAPMVGGMISSTILTLVVIPAIYSLWKERAVRMAHRATLQADPVVELSTVPS